MKFSDKFVKTHLELFRPLTDKANIDLSRSAQEKAGKVIRFSYRSDVVITDEDFGGVKGVLVVPRDELRTGIILYLHGGGYVSGGIEYTKGFSSVLSAECGMRVAAIDYRLAPENPYPAALDDCVSAYRALLDMGYSGDSILLAGESAGGGLCFSLSLKLSEMGLAMPAGILAVSPWCDLTHTAESHTTNKKADVTLTKEKLDYFARCYLGEHTNTKADIRKEMKKEVSEDYQEKLLSPYVSPVYADLGSMPPTLILVGGDEILLSDAKTMHEKLSDAGIYSKLIIREKMWHAYPIYCLKSTKHDYDQINSFIKKVFPKDSERKLRWMGIDNSGKIYPAAKTSRWTNVFRISATLTESVDRAILQSALDVTVRRFPGIAARLRRGTFWYYLEEISHAPKIMDEKAYPLSRMPFDDIRECAFRVLVYKKRIAVEFFHAITDGNGGLIFLKTLLAEYLLQKKGLKVPFEYGVLDRLEEPTKEELEDSFLKYAGKVSATRKEPDSYRIWGEFEEDSYRHLTSLLLNTDNLLSEARKRGVTITSLLTAALIKAGINLQNEDVPYLKKQKEVRVLVPCDLRRLYGVESLRNFALYATPGVDPRLGEYTFDELCSIVQKQLQLEITPKVMSAKIRTNVKDEENILLKLTPLFLKNAVMKLVFSLVGERKSMTTFSNLGAVKLPIPMREHIERFDFVLNVQSRAPYNTSVISYGDLTVLSVIRNITEPRLEMALYKVLREVGIKVKVESNQR